jgi:hypothetical protein
MAADYDPFEVSVPLLVELLPRICSPSALQFEQLVHSGRKHGLLRASPRLMLKVPQVELSCYQLAPPDLPRQRPVRAPGAPRARAPKPTTRVCGSQVQRQRRQASQQAKAIRATQAKAAQPLSCPRESPDPLLIEFTSVACGAPLRMKTGIPEVATSQ